MGVVDDYIAGQDDAHRAVLTQLRDLVRSIAPEAGEVMAYGVPTFTLNGNLVHLGAAARHVGFYPGPEGVELVAPELDALGLRHSKGAIQLPLDRPLPLELLERVVRHRTAQQRERRR